jgi:type II secretory pathway pseudopilin PulG
MIILKKGAMFGLDARIALAIFGALSVISGAALYSAIQESKTTQVLVYLEEYSKAITQYYLDTASILPNLSNSNSFKEGNLFTNYEGVNGWNGPYFGDGSTADHKISSNLISKVFGSSYMKTDGISTYKYMAGEWSGTDADFGSSCTATDCYMYLAIIGGGTSTPKEVDEAVTKMALKLDQKVDGGDGSRKGKIRYRNTSDGAANSHIIYYKNIPFKQ